MLKVEKREYNKSYFIKYIETNNFLKKYYCEKSATLRTYIKCWKSKHNEDDDNISDIED